MFVRAVEEAKKQGGTVVYGGKVMRVRVGADSSGLWGQGNESAGGW